MQLVSDYLIIWLASLLFVKFNNEKLEEMNLYVVMEEFKSRVEGG